MRVWLTVAVNNSKLAKLKVLALTGFSSFKIKTNKLQNWEPMVRILKSLEIVKINFVCKHAKNNWRTLRAAALRLCLAHVFKLGENYTDPADYKVMTPWYGMTEALGGREAGVQGSASCSCCWAAGRWVGLTRPAVGWMRSPAVRLARGSSSLLLTTSSEHRWGGPTRFCCC